MVPRLVSPWSSVKQRVQSDEGGSRGSVGGEDTTAAKATRMDYRGTIETSFLALQLCSTTFLNFAIRKINAQYSSPLEPS